MTRISQADIVADLAAETEVLEDLVLGLSASEWELPTPATGWTIRDQVSHLAFFDEAAVIAMTEPVGFRREAKDLLNLGPDFPDQVAERFRQMPVPDLADWFGSARSELMVVLERIDPKARIPWYGPDMSAMSLATARLMETWAHGLDIADAVGAQNVATDRLRHIAHLGYRTLGFSFALRGRPAPQADVHVELTAPGGGQWTWGPPDAEDSVTGSALDFCLAVTQRRHRSELDLVVRGPVASEWMVIAQAFAGSPGPGRAPVQLAIREVS